MDNSIHNIIGTPESDTLEYKAVLPPSKNIAQQICSFANTRGGWIVLGVSDDLTINGLSEDFHANSITHKAIDLLSPTPKIDYGYLSYKNKKLYVIRVEKSESPVLLEGKLYKREGTSNRLMDPVPLQFSTKGYSKAKSINELLEAQKADSTSSQIKFVEHYQSILKIIDDLGDILYPEGPNKLTQNQEGKILSKILFSSFVDNFETYLSDLLYEIYLANPSTLKSSQTVTIEEVLNCSDLQEFIKYWSKQKLSKLQKGSVKGFVKDNKQIRDLNALDQAQQSQIENILQIRHLYSHRNGIVDDKFLKFFPTATINLEYQLSVEEICDTLIFLAECSKNLDVLAKRKFQLASVN